MSPDGFGARGSETRWSNRRSRRTSKFRSVERFDVDSAGSDVRRDQNAILAALESGQRRGALWLRAVTVNALRFYAALHQLLGQSVRAVLGAGEYERLGDIVAVQEREQQRRLEILPHRIDRWVLQPRSAPRRP